MRRHNTAQSFLKFFKGLQLLQCCYVLVLKLSLSDYTFCRVYKFTNPFINLSLILNLYINASIHQSIHLSFYLFLDIRTDQKSRVLKLLVCKATKWATGSHFNLIRQQRQSVSQQVHHNTDIFLVQIHKYLEMTNDG